MKTSNVRSLWFTNSLEDFTVNYLSLWIENRHDMKGTPSNRVTLQQK